MSRDVEVEVRVVLGGAARVELEGTGMALRWVGVRWVGTRACRWGRRGWRRAEAAAAGGASPRAGHTGRWEGMKAGEKGAVVGDVRRGTEV